MGFLISTFQLFYFPRYQGVPNLHQGALRPLDAPQRRNIFTQSEYFTISNSVFNVNILALVVSEILGGSQIYVRGPCAPFYAPSGKIFVPEASTLLCLMAFSISTFYLLYFPRYQGSQIYTRGPYAPWMPLSENFFTQSEYFTISNCVFNFNILALVVSDILGGPKFTLGGAVTPCTPPSGIFFVPQASTLLCRMAFLISTFYLFYFPRYQGVPNLHQVALRPLSENFFTQSEYFTISNCVFNFNILALVVSEILNGSQIYVRGPCAPLYAPQRKFFLYPRRVRYYI